MNSLKRISLTEMDVASKRSSKVNESMREMDEKIKELNADTLARLRNVAAIRPIADSEVISQTPPVARPIRPISEPVRVPLPSVSSINPKNFPCTGYRFGM